ncbi:MULTISPECIES: M1 family metallopeptidase [Thermoanaerobacterium]|uniref:Peptidase M1 membrane alanine aminopeptidase n=2 Tax=Thermoanaerobacterium TaxID=28895 RepID=W9EDZ6_9THEO|nr:MULTISPECIES: M1 family metallopeptidase [Thermoanaerobacterium]AFK85478.1 Peptidase M1 membrane alanine aminopeptidase [Thermoanaerobacterium saccharolyticum JW/SL-YS485]ETO39436.1 Peptidase M1 membrane alanine aminopeptidase [Thermoanaerobacterium aotearoense SCUT27]
MKSKKYIWLVILVAAIGLLIYFAPIKNSNRTVYNMDLKYNDKDKTIIGTEAVDFINTDDVNLSEVYMHLYPNAFKDKSKVPFTKEEMGLAYPNGFKPGYIEINDVTFGKNEKATYSIDQKTGEILKILLPKKLGKGDRISFTIDFKVQIPPSCGRFGYGNNTIQVTNFYPILSVYDQNGWNNDPYYALGDPFYSDVSNYRVKLAVPKGMEVATTGVVTSKIRQGDMNVLTIDAPNVRDFAVVMSSKFKVAEGDVDGIRVKSYYFDEDSGLKALKYAQDAIRFYNSYIGKYPYKEYSVVESDFYMGGMEYPNLVFISKDLYSKDNLFNLEYVIAHETAHQWWYGVVGNNEVREAWLDEGLTEYTTIMYIERYYGKATADAVFKSIISGEFYKFSKTNKDDAMVKTLGQFKDWNDYTNIVYNKGAMVFNELRSLIGDEKFKEVLDKYYSEYKYKNATTQNLIDVVDSVTGKDTGGFFEEWLD